MNGTDTATWAEDEQGAGAGAWAEDDQDGGDQGAQDTHASQNSERAPGRKEALLRVFKRIMSETHCEIRSICHHKLMEWLPEEDRSWWFPGNKQDTPLAECQRYLTQQCRLSGSKAWVRRLNEKLPVQVTKVPVQVTKCHYVNVAKDLSELSLRSYGSIRRVVERFP